MNANIRASVDLIDRIFPKGVLSRNDKTTMKTVEPIKKGDNFRDQIKAFFAFLSVFFKAFV
jgi:hypothetical protein